MKEKIKKDYKEHAMELFKNKCNCSQAVLTAFCDQTGLDQKTSLKIASSFGGGMGRMREVCGAVSAMFMVAGLIYGYDDLNDKNKKDKHYKLIQELAEEFKMKTGSIVCKELLGLDKKENTYVSEKRTKEYYKKRPCIELVGLAAQILENKIKQEV